MTMDLLCRRTFGEKGSYLSSAILGFTQIGWFGVGVAMFSIPAAQLMGVNEWVLTIIAGLLMTATAATGMKALEIVSYISVPLIVILGMYSMITATSEGGGLAAIFAQSAGGITLMTGIGYVIGSFISGGTATPNFIRFAKNSKIAVWTTVIAFFLGNTLMFCFGAVGGAFTGKDDIFYVMIAQGLAIPALIVLPAIPGFFAASLSASACASCVYTSTLRRSIPSRALSSIAFSNSAGRETFSKLKSESSRPISSKRLSRDFLTASESSMRFAAISTTEMPLSPIASEIAITSILLMWSVMSSVLKVE